MKDLLKELPPDIQDLIKRISDVAARHTVPVYLVGGFVRDLIMGRPNLDLDVVVEGDGLAYAEALAADLNAKIVLHRRFGTATIYRPGHHKIDIATARKETYAQPGHLPDVVPGLLKEDLFRRDFTINAMAIDIGREKFGSLIDTFGGRADLSAGLVRVLHQVSFIDDPTRILRAVRFEQRYHFKIEPRTLAYLKEAVKAGMLAIVEPQRTRDDIVLIMKEADPVKPIERLKRLAGFSFIHPRLRFTKESAALMRGCLRQIAWFGKQYAHRRKIDAWLVCFMALTDGLDAAALREIQKKFVFRRGEAMRMDSFGKIKYKAVQAMSRSDVRPARIFSFFEPLSYEVILALKAKYANRGFQKRIEDFFEIYNGMRPVSSGHDVGKLGLSPGPEYRRIFASVLRAKINGKVRTHGEEIALIGKLVKRATGGKKNDTATAG